MKRTFAALLSLATVVGLFAGFGSVQTAPAGAADSTNIALTLPSSKGGYISERTAEDSRALLQHSTSTAQGWKDSTASTAKLVIRARGEQCEGAPELRVSVGGRVVLTASVNSEEWREYTSNMTVPTEPAPVEVEFTNDLLLADCDRNVLTDFVAFSPASDAASSASDAVLFDADVGRNGLSAYANVIHGEHISIVDDPVLGQQRKVMRFTVNEGDTGPTADPRAQVETPKMFREGEEFWVGWSSLFPSDWPDRLPSGGSSWITLSELYGAPYSGAGPVKLGMRSGANALSWQRNGTYGWDVPWEGAPVQKNRWYDYVLHVKLSADPDVGFVELYINMGEGWEQQDLGGVRRLYTRTLDATNGGGPNYHKLALYRKRDMYPVLTVFHAEHRVGTSFDAVAPQSYPSAASP